jgi:hypothetical protein
MAEEEFGTHAACRVPRLASSRGAPFLIPDLETSEVQLKGPPAGVQRDPFHQQLGLREDRVAGVARFPVAWTTPNRSNAITRQTPGSELAQDETTESFLVHRAV